VLKKSLEEAVSHYETQVDWVGDYLHGRGISKEAAVTRRLGYVGDALIGHEQYVGRLAIPYLTPTGVVDVRFRIVDSDSDAPKYMGRPGVETSIYGVNAFSLNSSIIGITEGEMDALVLEEMCGLPAVGIPGAQAWKPFYWRAFEDYDKVYVFADGDQPGMDFAKKIASALDSAVIIQMPDKEDVNSTFLIEGADGIRKRAGL
jgi:DNA primase